jgi:hypothetical protein
MVSDSFAPVATPGPHLAPLVQVITPPTSDQPWLASSASAPAMLKA